MGSKARKLGIPNVKALVNCEETCGKSVDAGAASPHNGARRVCQGHAGRALPKKLGSKGQPVALAGQSAATTSRVSETTTSS